MGKNKNKNHQKKKQKRAVKNAVRKALHRRANAAVRRYMKGRRMSSPEAPPEAATPGLALSDRVTFPHCSGVGECCKNRPIYVEPTDVYRILHNERAQEKFGLGVTMDLYPDEDGKPGPLVYRVDEKSLMPFCAVHRVELSTILPDESVKPGIEVQEKDQACPFLEFMGDGTPECILGDDRLTQCASDPICRTGRLDHKKRLAGWEYALIDQQCLGCRQADQDKEREEVVGEWLQRKGMEDRLLESDLFHGFLAWQRDQMKVFPEREDQEFFWKMAANMMFDWHHFAIRYLEQPKEEVIKHGPGSSKEVFMAARAVMEGIINGHKGRKSNESGVVDEGSEQNDEAQGDTDKG